MKLELEKEVEQALSAGQPVVALESTLITHGLPRPVNLEVARELEKVVRDAGAVPATIAILDGVVHIGLSDEQLVLLANADHVRKCSRRDLGIVMATGEHGATTVAATAYLAARAGIRVFATGGIGGVHRGHPFDISADLEELGRTPVAVVCAGAKAILDLPLTREALETRGVPVIGFQTTEFPAFYTRSSGLEVDHRCDSAAEIAAVASAHWGAGLDGGILVTVPIPKEDELPKDEMNAAIDTALREAEQAGVSGKEVTPFLLARVSELTGDRSRAANVALLRNNARVAAGIAAALS